MREEDDNRAIKDNSAKYNEAYDETQTDPNGFFSDLKTAAACSVRVALRVRPLVGRELYESPNICVTCYQESNQLVIGKDRAFTFDKVFDIPTCQEEVFDSCVKNLVLGCFAGFNATVLAYGQTGSGKTFTMGSGYTIGLKDEELGIIPRVIKLIFEEVDKRKHKAEFIIKCCFLEIYNEELNDLLEPGSMNGGQGQQNSVLDRFMQKKEITIREEKNGNISVFGLKEEKVNTYEELAACLDRGSNFRSTASTLMNNCSSRSHAIFTISIEQHVIDDLYQPSSVQPAAANSPDEFMVAKFHFVDLAGSERAKRTGATGATLKEGISINKGLLALGNVISALTEDGKKNAHVPYRDSKLTRILQDSLGGNSRTSMIACVSPAEVNFEETLNTLKYASRARNIKNKPIVNRDPNSAQIAQLRQQIYELSRELLGARKLLINNNIAFEEGTSVPTDLSLLEGGSIMPSTGHTKEYMIGGAEIQKYENEIKELKTILQQRDKKINQNQAMLDTTQEQLSQSRIEFFTVQKERDLSRFQLEQLIQILKKREIFEDIMKEFHGFNKSNQNGDDPHTPMDIDEQRDGNAQLDFVFGSSGPCILEEYQVKVEEQKRELNEKMQQLKQLQKDNEFLVEQAIQDTQNLENKEKEIERLKRSNNKLQKENVQIRNDQRRGTVNNRAGNNVPQQNNNNQQKDQPQTSSNYNTARRATTSINNQRNFNSTSSQIKRGQEAQQISMLNNPNMIGGPTIANGNAQEDWLTKELDYNLTHFNEMFIENLSQSLSSMLVLKKTKDQQSSSVPSTVGINQKMEDINPLTEIQEDNENLPHDEGKRNEVNDGNVPANEENSSDSDEEHANERLNNNAQEIEHILPQGEKEIQEVIESHEETKQQDEEIKTQLDLQQLQLNSLDGDLLEKERLLQAIKDSHKAMSQNLLDTMKQEYHKKIQQFQSEMQQLEQERVESLKKAGSDKQKSQLEEQYKKKLKDLEDKLRDAKQKDREQTTMMKESNKQKLRIKSLEQEIEKMKTQRVTMMKRMKEESEQHRKWKADRVKELMQMKQANLKKDREIQLLKRDNQRKDILAKRKQEELSLLMKKNKIEKQKSMHVTKEKLKKSNLDINAIQQWIITNTEKMLNYKDLQSGMEGEIVQRKQVEDQITEEQNQLAGLNVRKEKLEFKKCQFEQQNQNGEVDEQIYLIEEEITQITYEMKAVQENVETLEEKFDFIDEKVTQLNLQMREFSPDDIQQLKFDQVQSIEGARACLGAFFGILLDVNIYKKQLENKVAADTANIDSLTHQMEDLRKQLQAAEINFQKQIEQMSRQYREKEDTMIKIIMENGGQELEQMIASSDGKMGSGSHILREYMKQNSQKVEDDTQSMFGASAAGQPGLTRRNTAAVNTKQVEIQKNKEQMFLQSKTALSKRVAELERKTKEDQKKLESMKHMYEQTNQDKEVLRKQLDQTKKKLKLQEVQEVKQSKLAPILDDPSNFNSNVLQKSPRNPQQKQMATLNDLRKDRKMKKQLGGQNPAQGANKQPLIEPRVIADEPMEDDNDEMIFEKDIDLQSQKTNPFGAASGFDSGLDQESNDVFTRLSQLGNKSKGATLNTSLNISQTTIQPQSVPVEKYIPQSQAYDDDGKWKCHMSKEMAHNSQVFALASVGNQLYSTSNKSLRIWDLEKFQTVSDINVNQGMIKSLAVMNAQRILLTASDKTIYLWDMISLTMAGKLQNHKEEIRAMTMCSDDKYLFSAGKGSPNAHGLLIWDLRKFSQPVEEREKNQDIFSLKATKDMLFYGCRSHQVIPYNFIKGEQYNALEPPHFDAVTSLAILDGYLISGSRDKMVRVWDHQKLSQVQVETAHNDFVNVLETDQDQKEMYSGCKDGIVKVWRMKQGKIRCMAQVQASVQSQSINALTKIDKQFGQMFATGSSDKSIKIWKRKQESVHNLSHNEGEDLDLLDPFDKALIDRNQDYYGDDICQDDYQLLNQINKQEELKHPQNINQQSDKQGSSRPMTSQSYNSNQQPGTNQFTFQQQQQQQQQFAQQTQNYYQSNSMQMQQSKLEQKRRQKRIQENQKRYQKENDQNYQI